MFNYELEEKVVFSSIKGLTALNCLYKILFRKLKAIGKNLKI